MSLIDSIFGAAVDAALNDDAVVNDRTARGENKNEGPRTKPSPDGNHLHSLFHTVIPLPDRKLEYNIKKDKNSTTKKRGTAAASPALNHNKRLKKSDDDDDDEDDLDDGTVGNRNDPSLQHGATTGTDDTDKNERTVFVGNVPITYTRKHLRQLFIDCGSIESTRIRGIAIPTDDTETKQKALEDTNGKKKSVIKLPPSLAGQQQIYKKVCINTRSSAATGIDTAKKQSNIGYVVFHHKDSVEKALMKNNIVVPVGPVLASSLSGTSMTATETTSKGKLDNVRHLRVDRCVTTLTNKNAISDDHTLRDPKRTIFIGNLPYHTDEETLHQHVLQHMKLESTGNNSSNESIIESIRIVRNPTTYLCQGFAYVLFTSIQYVPTALKMLHQTTYMKQVLRIQTCKSKTKSDQGGKQSNREKNSANRSVISSRNGSPEHHSKPTTNTSRTSSSATPIRTATTKAVGALKRVLQKQQRLLSLDNQKTKPIRKRGPTTTKHKVTKKPTAAKSKMTKKPTTSSRKKQK